MSWNDARIETLKQLWNDGFSASQIAARLGGVTRSGVIGKVHRLGLAGRATTSRIKSSRSRRSTKRKPMLVSFQKPASPVRMLFDPDGYVPPAEELVIPLNERKYIHTLEETDCRWPIGDPRQPDFHFCGKNKLPGLPYCEVHARRAFQPPKPRPPSSPMSAPVVEKQLEAA